MRSFQFCNPILLCFSSYTETKVVLLLSPLAQELKYVDKQTSTLKDNLDRTQEELEDKVAENMQKKELINKLSSELKGHKEDKSKLVNLLEIERY